MFYVEIVVVVVSVASGDFVEDVESVLDDFNEAQKGRFNVFNERSRAERDGAI